MASLILSTYPFNGAYSAWYSPRGAEAKISFYKRLVLPLVWLELGDVSSILKLPYKKIEDLAHIANNESVQELHKKMRGVE